MITLAVDFDGTLAEGTGATLKLRPGARAAVLALKRGGARLILHSCRCNPPENDEDRRRFAEMRSLLQRQGIWSMLEPWQSPGKPIAEVYIDDRAEEPDWGAILALVGVKSRR